MFQGSFALFKPPFTVGLRRLLSGLTAILLAGCVSYRETSTQMPASSTTPTSLITGSNIPVPIRAGSGTKPSTLAPVSVYSRTDIERTGATDLGQFLRHVPFAQVR